MWRGILQKYQTRLSLARFAGGFATWFRRTREQQALEHWAACQSPAEDPEQDALENLELERMLAQIPGSARDVVRLWLEGYRWQEIAQRLGISASACPKCASTAQSRPLRANLGI